MRIAMLVMVIACACSKPDAPPPRPAPVPKPTTIAVPDASMVVASPDASPEEQDVLEVIDQIRRESHILEDQLAQLEQMIKQAEDEASHAPPSKRAAKKAAAAELRKHYEQTKGHIDALRAMADRAARAKGRKECMDHPAAPGCQ